MEKHILRKATLFIHILVPLALFLSCEGFLKWEAPEKTYELPPITTTGETTFGCHVNGELWLFGGVGLYPKLTCFYYKDILYLDAERNDKKIVKSDFWNYSAIGIKLKNPNSRSLEGKYILGDTTSHIYAQVLNFGYLVENPVFYTDSNSTGVIEILKHDTVSRIVSGLFEFKAVYPSTDSIVVNDTIVVTDGRFDVTY